MKNRIKSITYNYTTDHVALLPFVIMFGICLYTQNIINFAIFILIASFIIISITANILRNKERNYIILNYCLFDKKKVWINQKVKKSSKNNTKCLRYEFLRAIILNLKNIDKNAICYTYTHEFLVKHLLEKESRNEVIILKNVFIKEKSLNKVRKSLQNDKCRSCKEKENCSIFAEETTKYYAVKFIKIK